MSDVQASPPALPAELGTRVMEAAPVVILFLDPDGTIRYANPCFEALSGYRLDEIRGKSWFETLLPARDRDRIRVLFQERMAGSRQRASVNVIVTRSGEERALEWTDELLRDRQGNVIGLLSIGHDVTDRSAVENELRASEQRLTEGQPIAMAGTNQDITDRKRVPGAARRALELLHSVVSSSPVVLFGLDRTGVFTLSEGRALDKLGLHPGEVVGTSALEMYADLPGFHEAFRRALAGQQTTLVARVGALVEFEVEIGPSLDEQGRIDGVIGVAFDVTERKRTEAELQASLTEQQRLVGELRDVDRRKNDFIAVLSHELRNPLAAIENGLFVVARSPAGSEQARRAVAIVERQTAQLTRLVDDLLDVSRITQNKIQLKRCSVDIDRLAAMVVDDYQATFARRGVQLQLVPACETLVVDGDPARLTQVLGNLLSNAAKFTPAGGMTTVQVARDLDGHRALLRVSDSGVGIAPEMVDRLFQPFSQADRTLARSMGGLGLGLALVKGLVELHGGEVRASSNGEGCGAVFEVRLPLASVAERPATAAKVSASRPKRHVLLIEDNIDAAEALRDVLELEGHAVEVAHDGIEGIRVAHQRRPEIVLCDLGLPGLSGYDVARELASDEGLHNTTLVALSGYAAPNDVARARAAGFGHHLAKPVDLERLRAVLAAA